MVTLVLPWAVTTNIITRASAAGLRCTRLSTGWRGAVVISAGRRPEKIFTYAHNFIYLDGVTTGPMALEFSKPRRFCISMSRATRRQMKHGPIALDRRRCLQPSPRRTTKTAPSSRDSGPRRKIHRRHRPRRRSAARLDCNRSSGDRPMPVVSVPLLQLLASIHRGIKRRNADQVAAHLGLEVGDGE